MQGQDWEDVIIRKPKPKGQKAQQAQAVSNGASVETVKKFNAGTNKNSGPTNAKKVEESEDLHHEHVQKDVAQIIMQTRNAKGWTQKELSTKINEKPQVVAEYEQGKAIPNQQILGKLERALGVRLRGKDIGAPLAPKGKSN